MTKEKVYSIGQRIEFLKSIEETYSNCKVKLFKDKSCNYPFIILNGFFGKKLISIPFLDSGGFLGNPSKETIKEIKEFAKKEKLKDIEIRINNFFPNFEKTKELLLNEGFKFVKNKQQAISILPNSQEKLWEDFHKHTRNDIRKAERSGIIAKKINNLDELKKFYKIYSIQIRNFGTPQHSFKFFKNIFKNLGADFFGLNCYLQKRVIASLIAFYGKGYCYVGFNVSTPKFREFRPNDLLYWETIKESITRGALNFDMGQVNSDYLNNSREGGLTKFKEKWGPKKYDKFIFNLYSNGEINKKEKLKLFRVVWKRLPLSISKKIGPNITKRLGI